MTFLTYCNCISAFGRYFLAIHLSVWETWNTEHILRNRVWCVRVSPHLTVWVLWSIVPRGAAVLRLSDVSRLQHTWMAQLSYLLTQVMGPANDLIMWCRSVEAETHLNVAGLLPSRTAVWTTDTPVILCCRSSVTHSICIQCSVSIQLL